MNYLQIISKLSSELVNSLYFSLVIFFLSASVFSLLMKWHKFLMELISEFFGGVWNSLAPTWDIFYIFPWNLTEITILKDHFSSRILGVSKSFINVPFDKVFKPLSCQLIFTLFTKHSLFSISNCDNKFD